MCSTRRFAPAAFVAGALVFALSIAACTPQQLASTQAGINAAEANLAATIAFVRPLVAMACSAAMSAAEVALAVRGTNPTVASLATYAKGGCGTAAAIDQLARDPTSPEWVGKLTGALQAFAG